MTAGFHKEASLFWLYTYLDNKFHEIAKIVTCRGKMSHFDDLFHSLDLSIQLMTDLIQFIKRRQAVENEYAKNLGF